MKQFISRNVQMRSITTKAHLKYITAANTKYPQRKYSSDLAVVIGNLAISQRFVEGRSNDGMIRGRLMMIETAKRGISRLVQYGNGCFVK